MALLYRMVMLGLLIYLGFGLLLYVYQRDFIYFPTQQIEHDFAERVVDNDDQSIRVIVVNPDQPRAVIYFGGNGESIAHSAESYSRLFPGHSVYLVNYRGYGGSSGEPSEAALFSDALAVYDAVSPQHASIAVIGRSLGSGVASYLAAHRSISRLVLVTPFDSIESMARQRYRYFPVSLMLKDRFRSVDYVAAIDVPTLVVLAENDLVVPFNHSMALIERFPEQLLNVVTIKGGGHNSLSYMPEYFLQLRRFISGDLSG